MKCPYGCGWEGSPAEYARHFDVCPARTGRQVSDVLAVGILKIVYRDVDPSQLELILSEGLKRNPEKCNPHNQWMDVEAEKRKLPIRRCNCIYAYIPGWGRLLKKGESPMAVFEGLTTISFKVDPTKVYVADMEVATEASQWYGGYEYTKKRTDLERAKLFRSRYWDEIKTLAKASPEEFNEMEILIPFNINPEEIEESK